MPQMKGAGVTLAYIFPGLPYWVGVVLVGAVITLNVALGGMKGITLVQAVQYWIKMFAISVPVFVLMAVFGFYGGHIGANKVAGETVAPVTEVTRKPLTEKAPADEAWVAPFGPLTTKAVAAAAKALPEGERAAFLAEKQKPYSLLYTYSLIIAIVCGTAGLPHILVRFYTNPDGIAAKRTTMWVMILIGVFYVFPPVFGVIGRNLLPELYAGVGAKGTDKIVLELPRLIAERYGVVGSILSGITCAGAFAAFMSTFSGLLVSMTGALAHDVYGRILRPGATPAQRMRAFKFAAVLIGGVAVVLGCFVEPLEINFMVGQAFAIAAASYFPLLFMSVWWRGMTMKGAATGMLAGGLCADQSRDARAGQRTDGETLRGLCSHERFLGGASVAPHSLRATGDLGRATGDRLDDRRFKTNRVADSSRCADEDARAARAGKTWAEAGVYSGAPGGGGALSR
jgi:cation/acetate symporter